MKISNTKEAIKKIGLRAHLIEQRNRLLYKGQRIIIDSNYGESTVDVTDMIDAEAIRLTAIENFNKKIADVAYELKELGVYIDTDEAVVQSHVSRMF